MLADDEKAEDKLVFALIGEAIKNVFENHGDVADMDALVEQFAGGKISIEVGDEIGSQDLLEVIDKIKGLKNAAAKVCNADNGKADEPADLAAAAEFVLESLFVNNRLSKYAYHGRTIYKR